jgi:hypothetical protein
MSNAARKIRRYAERHKHMKARVRDILSKPIPRHLSGIIVHGAGCCWWDIIENAGAHRPPRQTTEQAISEKGDSFRPASLPCCPFCGSVLFQHDSEKEFWAGSAEYEKTHPGYVALMTWMKGKCFKTMSEAAIAYESEAGIHYEVAT